MEESPAIYDIAEAYRIWIAIWTSLERGIQSLALTLFGRSNRSYYAEFPYLSPLKISARSDRSNSRNLPISASLFRSIFCARMNPTQVHLCYEWDFGHPFCRNLFLGYCVWFPNTCSQILLLFGGNLHPHAGVKPARQCCSTAADLR